MPVFHKNGLSCVVWNMREKMLAIFGTNLDKELEESRKSLKRLQGYDYFCENDALKAAGKWIADHPLLVFKDPWRCNC